MPFKKKCFDLIFYLNKWIIEFFSYSSRNSKILNIQRVAIFSFLIWNFMYSIWIKSISTQYVRLIRNFLNIFYSQQNIFIAKKKRKKIIRRNHNWYLWRFLDIYANHRFLSSRITLVTNKRRLTVVFWRHCHFMNFAHSRS